MVSDVCACCCRPVACLMKNSERILNSGIGLRNNGSVSLLVNSQRLYGRK